MNERETSIEATWPQARKSTNKKLTYKMIIHDNSLIGMQDNYSPGSLSLSLPLSLFILDMFNQGCMLLGI